MQPHRPMTQPRRRSPRPAWSTPSRTRRSITFRRCRFLFDLGSPRPGEPISFPAMRFLAIVLLLVAGPAWAGPREIVVCQYNVENYVDTKAPGEGSRFGTREKSEK